MGQNVSFEQAIEQLQNIVKKLESGDVSLEDSLKQFEEGVKLSRFCQTYLSQAEKKIEVLVQGKSDLDSTLKPFDPSQTE
ncbi:MAG: exodeoxyribonuclease VII small subunit [Xanthomonadaceae bacterium]|nr:exodeoxyribonuclease VII small subunit [Xanthomonadaceae bacterium]